MERNTAFSSVVDSIFSRLHGADMALLFDDDCLVDGDRCMPVLLDADGVAYHPKPSQGALD